MASKISDGYQDAADFAASRLLRKYPEIEVEQYTVHGRRPALRIIVPIHTEYTIPQIDREADIMMRELYIASDCQYLIACTIERRESDDHTETESDFQL